MSMGQDLMICVGEGGWKSEKGRGCHFMEAPQVRLQSWDFKSPWSVVLRLRSSQNFLKMQIQSPDVGNEMPSSRKVTKGAQKAQKQYSGDG